MTQQLAEHVTNAAKVTAGGIGTTGTIWAAIVAFLHKMVDMPLDHATQIANLAAAIGAAVYYLVATFLAIKSRSKNGNKS